LAGVSALLAGVLSSCFAKKKVAKEEGDPGSVPAAPVPCATQDWRGLRNSGFALRQSSPFIRQPLRCSAPLKGPGKASIFKPWISFFGFFPVDHGNRFFGANRLSVDAFRVPVEGAEQRRRAGGLRLALFESQASFGKPPGPTSSARNPAGAPPLGSPSFWLLFLGEARKSTPASKAESRAN